MNSRFSSVLDFAKIIIIALVIVAPIRMLVFQPFLVRGDSMVPNFYNGDYLIIDEISYRLRSPQRGEVIVFKFPLDTSHRYIKRLIGLPGETVQIKEGSVVIVNKGDETLLQENYLPLGLQTQGEETIVLQENEFFVLGDNRQFSSDSRVWGVVPRSDIIGKVFVRVFPLNAFAAFATPLY